jgi:zinc-ribbon domain
MALVECKECGAQVSENAATCPSCGDVIKEPKPKFSLVDLIHKISVPVVLSVAGTMITILTYFSMEGERQMEQTRKLLADAFDKDPIKQQYCIFYVDHLLASGRISPEMTVSVLSTVAANATNETVRLDALRMMPQLLLATDLPTRAKASPGAEHFEPDSNRDRSRSLKEATNARHSYAGRR